MPTQADFTKVNEHVIQPLQRLYGTEINDYAIEAMVEDLCRYSNASLQNAIKHIRRTRKRSPSLADLIEACNYSPEESKGNPSDYREKKRAGEEKIHDEAWAAAYKATQCRDGLTAQTEMYATELFGHLFDTARSQIKSGKTVFLQIPDPIPADWIKLGRFRKKSNQLVESNDRLKSLAQALPKPNINPGLDEFIAGKLAQRAVL